MIANSNDAVYGLFCKAVLSDNENQAISLYTKFIELDPKYGLTEAYVNRGILYTQLENKEIKLAIADFDKAVELGTKDPNVYYFRGYSYANLENYTKAIADFSTAIMLNPRFEVAYLLRGNSYFAQKEYTNAITNYNKVIALEKENDEAYLMRGLSFKAEGEFKKAIADFETVKKLSSDMPVMPMSLLKRQGKSC